MRRRSKARSYEERQTVGVKLSPLQSEFLFDLSLTLQAPLDIGAGPEGHRLIVMMSGGRLEGPRLSGTVLPLTGADWPRMRSVGRKLRSRRMGLLPDQML
jgi:hypothetical protein